MFQHFYWHFWITRRGVFIILFSMPCWHQQQLFNLQTIQIAFANFLRSTILLVLDKNFNILNFMTRIQVRIHSKLEKWKLWNTHIEKMLVYAFWIPINSVDSYMKNPCIHQISFQKAHCSVRSSNFVSAINLTLPFRSNYISKTGTNDNNDAFVHVCKWTIIKCNEVSFKAHSLAVALKVLPCIENCSFLYQ